MKIKNKIKREIFRKKILMLRDKLSEKDLNEKNREIFRTLLSLREIQQAETIFIYANFRSEVGTEGILHHFLKEGKRVAVPLTQVTQRKLIAVHITDPDSQLAPGYCRIPEPTEATVKSSVIDPHEIDTVIIPGSVFDDRGGRLGYGGGYYDRFLVDESPRAKRIALAFELQIVPKVAMLEHDQYMDIIVTEKRIIHCGGEHNA